MKYIIAFTLFIVLATSSQAQIPATNQESKGPGWFFTPEYSLMFLEGHTSNAVGVSLGASLFKRHLKVGLMAYGASGPINPTTFTIRPSGDQLYKGQSELDLRADHGAFGIMVAPSFRIKGFEIDLPIMAGMLGAGFYLLGDDRITPDGRRVSEWKISSWTAGTPLSARWSKAGSGSWHPPEPKVFASEPGYTTPRPRAGKPTSIPAATSTTTSSA
jgi:hypothetical protein